MGDSRKLKKKEKDCHLRTIAGKQSQAKPSSEREKENKDIGTNLVRTRPMALGLDLSMSVV